MKCRFCKQPLKPIKKTQTVCWKKECRLKRNNEYNSRRGLNKRKKKPLKKKYTYYDLGQVKAELDKYSNLKTGLLIKHLNMPLHTKYAKIYNRLHKKEIAIRKDLQCIAKDPCPINFSTGCWECTGFYKEKLRKVKYLNFHKQSSRIYCVMAKKHWKTAIECRYKV